MNELNELAVRIQKEISNRRAFAEAATPGPWEWEDENYMGCGQVYTMGEYVIGGSIAAPSGDCYPRSGYEPKADMQFIALNDPERVLADCRMAEALLDMADHPACEKAYAEQILDALAKAYGVVTE